MTRAPLQVPTSLTVHVRDGDTHRVEERGYVVTLEVGDQIVTEGMVSMDPVEVTEENIEEMAKQLDEEGRKPYSPTFGIRRKV